MLITLRSQMILTYCKNINFLVFMQFFFFLFMIYFVRSLSINFNVMR